MKITRKKTKTGHTLILDGELTIYTVAAAKKSLLGTIDELVESVALDLRGITKLDTAGLQLLLFTQQIMADSNKHFYVKNSNEHVEGIFSAFALTDRFTMDA